MMNNTIVEPSIPLKIIFCNYFSRLIVIIFGYLNDLLDLIRGTSFGYKEVNRESYPPLYDGFTSFYYRNVARRIMNAWGFPIGSKPGTTVHILERIFELNQSKFKLDINLKLKRSTDANVLHRLSGRSIEAINFGSYNYLDYAQNSGPIVDHVQDTISQLGIGMATSSNEIGKFFKLTFVSII